MGVTGGEGGIRTHFPVRLQTLFPVKRSAAVGSSRPIGPRIGPQTRPQRRMLHVRIQGRVHNIVSSARSISARPDDESEIRYFKWC